MQVHSGIQADNWAGKPRHERHDRTSKAPMIQLTQRSAGGTVQQLHVEPRDALCATLTLPLDRWMFVHRAEIEYIIYLSRKEMIASSSYYIQYWQEPRQADGLGPLIPVALSPQGCKGQCSGGHTVVVRHHHPRSSFRVWVQNLLRWPSLAGHRLAASPAAVARGHRAGTAGGHAQRAAHGADSEVRCGPSPPHQGPIPQSASFDLHLHPAYHLPGPEVVAHDLLPVHEGMAPSSIHRTSPRILASKAVLEKKHAEGAVPYWGGKDKWQPKDCPSQICSQTCEI